MKSNLYPGFALKAAAIMLLIALVISLGVGAGLVGRVMAATLVVDNSDPLCDDVTGSPAFCTIQAAVNAAAAGDTVSVSAGTYPEQVVVNKSLTLSGAGSAATHIVAPAAASRQLFTIAESSATFDPLVFAFGGTLSGGAVSGAETISFTMSGFHVNGNNDAQASPRFAGILLRNVTGGVSDNLVNGLAPAAGNPQTGGIFLYGASNATISGNTISSHTRIGIVALGDAGPLSDPTAVIQGNTVNGLGPTPTGTWAENGIQMSDGASGSIQGNTVRDHSYAGDLWYAGSSLLVYGSSGVSVVDNTVINSQAGIYWQTANGSITGNNVSVTAPFAVCTPCLEEIDGVIVDPGAPSRLPPASPYGDQESLSLGADVEAPAAPDAVYSVSVNNNTVTGVPNTGNGTYGLWAIALGADTLDFSGSGNVVTGWDYGVVFYKDPTASLAVHDFRCNSFSGNLQYGAYNSTSPLTPISVENNWWGSASGPLHPALNPAGTGNTVSDALGFTPWQSTSDRGTCPAGGVGNWQNVSTGVYGDLQGLLDSAAPGSTIRFTGNPSVAIPGGFTLSHPGLTLDLNGGHFGHGSPFLTVTAADVTVLGPAVLDGAGDTSPAILVGAGGDNFTLKDAEVRSWANGVELAANVTSFKLIGNYIHNNAGAGLLVDSGVALGGIVTIQGNLFKDNTGNGVQNDGATVNLPAEYNSWGDPAGSTGALGDGVGGSVDADPWTFSELYLDVNPDAEATARTLAEGASFDVKLKLDARSLYGLTFRFTYNTTLLTLVGVDFASPWTVCLPLSAPAGTLAYRCNLAAPAPEYSAHAPSGTVATFHFTVNTAPLGDGPWQALFDILHTPDATSTAATGGVKVYINNAGYNAPSVADRLISDGNDGQIDIIGLARFTGFVDLQGRYNDSGGVVDVYNQAAKSGATHLASGTSSAGGGYTTAYLAPNQLQVGTSYWLVVDRPLYLPTTPLLEAALADSALLAHRPTTLLGTVLLLGGDATNDDLVDILDAGCIGTGYELPPAACGAGGSSDVNGDGSVDILDLALMGGNYDLSSSPWTP